MDLLLKGVVTGFILSIMIGPVFFVLLETSIRRGVKAALAFDFGVLLSDVFYIAIAYIFYNQVKALSESGDNSVLRLIGGVLFLVYGCFTLLKKSKTSKGRTEGLKESDKEDEDILLETKGARAHIVLGLKGFMLNFMNPMVVFYWFSVMTLGSQDTTGEYGEYALFIYLGIILATFFTVDFLKIIGAKRLRPLVTPKLLKGLNRLIGIAFVLFGLFLIGQAIYEMVTTHTN